MRNLKIFNAFILILTFVSCKKTTYTFTQADLIGTWTEVKPYITSNDPTTASYYNQPYILQFDSNNTVIETSPYQDTATYSLMSNNKLRLDCSIPEGPSCIGLGSSIYSISGDENDLTINVFLPRASVSASAASTYNLHLKKNN
jgi:hypothetical protein